MCRRRSRCSARAAAWRCASATPRPRGTASRRWPARPGARSRSRSWCAAAACTARGPRRLTSSVLPIACAAAARLAAVLTTPLGSPPTDGGELHDRRRVLAFVLAVRRRGSRAARACTGCTSAASPAGAGGSRARTSDGGPAGGARAPAASRSRAGRPAPARPRRRAGRVISARSGAASSIISSSRLPVVGSSGTTTRLDLRQRQRQDHEVGDVAEHQPDPGARSDAQRVQLLRAPVDAVEQAAPRKVRVAIDQRLRAAAISRDAREPLVKLHAAGCLDLPEAPDSLYGGGRPGHKTVDRGRRTSSGVVAGQR